MESRDCHLSITCYVLVQKWDHLTPSFSLEEANRINVCVAFLRVKTWFKEITIHKVDGACVVNVCTTTIIFMHTCDSLGRHHCIGLLGPTRGSHFIILFCFHYLLGKPNRYSPRPNSKQHTEMSGTSVVQRDIHLTHHVALPHIHPQLMHGDKTSWDTLCYVPR